MNYHALTNEELAKYANLDASTELEQRLAERLDNLLQYVRDLETEHETEKDKLERKNEELQETIDKLENDLTLCQYDKEKLEETLRGEEN